MPPVRTKCANSASWSRTSRQQSNAWKKRQHRTQVPNATVRARLIPQFGMYSTTTPRNDASPSRGQWNLADAYRYLTEAYGGYHFNALHGINVDAGIFVSYIGLFSYYNFDNWAYQPSYVSSNTPWYFNGVRVQIYSTEHLKTEPWCANAWQSYGRFNNRP